MFKHCLGVALAAVVTGGCQSLPQVRSSLSSYSSLTNEMGMVCLIGVNQDKLDTRIYGPEIAGEKSSGSDGASAETKTPAPVQIFITINHSDEPKRGDGQSSDEKRPVSVDTLDLSSVWHRSHACLRLYARQSGLIDAYDAGGSIVSGAGGLTALAAAGAAAPVTNAYIAGVSLTPVVLRDVANLDPQQANAFQALKAVSLAQCETESVRVARLLFDGDFGKGGNFKDAEALLTEKLEKARASQTDVVNMIRKGDGDTVADNAQSTAGTGAPLRTDTFQALLDMDRTLAADISNGERVSRALARFRSRTADEALAFRLHNQLQAINLIWGDAAASLLPTPEQTLRKLLASPLSLSARLVSGDSDKEDISPEVAAARFDYSPAQKPLALERIELAERIPVAVRTASSNEMTKATQAAEDLHAYTRELASALNEIPDAAAQCRPAARAG